MIPNGQASKIDMETNRLYNERTFYARITLHVSAEWCREQRMMEQYNLTIFKNLNETTLSEANRKTNRFLGYVVSMFLR